ncbi:hypothetical protein GCM10007049_26860 [Echinicola pacifica]|uniref:Iron-regulated membrane protein n=1 Tax=Echinicola pacifica TaxID=346377 RepID=A0A918USZ8_9BACT|nr:PepSY-associated TM helix domain-containing protein [Echinicola pacifica]GGZ32092.1 hypothetical protein GCM10007049_26860 [Echinicola pacifica]
MSNRIYNILFHTHTISGIIISAALYVIFFAGSFSFFRDEIIGWERNESISEDFKLGTLDLDRMLDTLDARKELYGRDIAFTKYFEERRINVSLSASKDTTATEEARQRGFFYLDTDTYQPYTYRSNYSIGEFLYRLHFFAQLNFWGTSGYMLSGFVAFFFLFAIITGVLVHWKKIVSNFYVFRPMASLKNLWTDAHTALGIIGLPYQFIYAVTGCCLIIGTTVMSPAIATFVYDGDTKKLYEDFGLSAPQTNFQAEKLSELPSVNAFMARAEARWPDFEVKTVQVLNYGDANMQVALEGTANHRVKFAGKGEIIYHASSGTVISAVDPLTETSYPDAATAVIKQLHFGDFGGKGLQIVYFILGLVSCFVIISGVMIWLVARDKKHIAPAKRQFNSWLVTIYLAICLSMFPVTALTFLAVKVFLQDFDESRMSFIYQVFFYSWLLLSVLFIVKKDNYFTNKMSLISGAVLGLCIPIANGLVTGNWLWKSYSLGQDQVFFIDAFWIVLSLTALWVASKLKKSPAARPLKSRPSHLKDGMDQSLISENAFQHLN